MPTTDVDPDVAQFPEDLPPVEPPSAGFILQLFVVPGLIVLAIVAVWALFGRLANSEQDWKGLLVELQHPNEHRRWRGALGLAQLLKADQNLVGSSEPLSRNREIAQALSDVLTTEIHRASQIEEDLKYQAFLARTLGLFDLPDVVIPALKQAMQPGIDREIRKNAIGSIAVIAHRFAEEKNPLAFSMLSVELLKVSQDEDPLIRQLCAFTLGLFPDADARSRLEVLLEDSDFDTRINSAIALARQGDARGTKVFEDVLRGASVPQDAATAVEYEQFSALKNCIAAIEQLAKKFDSEQRHELTLLLEPIAADYREPKIRLAAKTAVSVLRDTP